MEFFDVISNRHSIRAFQDRPLADEDLRSVLAAANQAPSAGNLQAYEIYVLRDAPRRLALARAAWSQMFIAEAPAVLVFAAHPARSAGKYGRRGIELYSLQDTTIACAFAMLAATALGIASVWVGAFDEDAVCEIIGPADPVRPVVLLALGYAAEKPPGRGRRSLSELVHYL